MSEQGWPKDWWPFREMFQWREYGSFWQSDGSTEEIEIHWIDRKWHSCNQDRKKPSWDLGSIRPLLPEIHNRSQRTCWDWAACDFSTHHPSSPSALLDRNVLHDTQDLQLRGMFSGWDTLRVSRERRRDYGTLGLILSVSRDFTFSVDVQRRTEKNPQRLWKRTVFHSEEEGWATSASTE